MFMAAITGLSYAQDGVPLQFGSKEIQLWEKSAHNLQDTIPWNHFFSRVRLMKTAQGMKDKFVEYTAEGTKFLKLPGFEDGNCLWTHLGLSPEKMYHIFAKSLSDVQEVWINNNMNMTSEMAGQFLEMIDALDPLEQVTKESQSIETRLGLLAENDATVRKNWLVNLKRNGGAAVAHNGSYVAFRPLNSDIFFQNVADELGSSVHIFTPNSRDGTLETTRIIDPKILNRVTPTLYLVQDSGGNGTHYDVAVPWGKPVSQAVLQEMVFFLKTKRLLS